MVTTTDIGAYLLVKRGNPTEVIHGTNDLRVPFIQRQEFYHALKFNGGGYGSDSLGAHSPRPQENQNS